MTTKTTRHRVLRGAAASASTANVAAFPVSAIVRTPAAPVEIPSQIALLALNAFEGCWLDDEGNHRPGGGVVS